MLSWLRRASACALLLLPLACGDGLSSEEAAEVCSSELEAAERATQCEQTLFMDACMACYEECDSCAAVYTVCPPTFSCADNDPSQ